MPLCGFHCIASSSRLVIHPNGLPVMVGKIRENALERLSALAAKGAAEPAPSPVTPVTGVSASEPPAAPRPMGRPKGEPTVPMQLRIPETMMTELLRRAAEASVADRRHTTPQTIALRILAAALGTTEGQGNG